MKETNNCGELKQMRFKFESQKIAVHGKIKRTPKLASTFHILIRKYLSILHITTTLIVILQKYLGYFPNLKGPNVNMKHLR